MMNAGEESQAAEAVVATYNRFFLLLISQLRQLFGKNYSLLI